MTLTIRQTGFVFLAFLVLFSTTGVTIYHHICGCPVPSVPAVHTSQSTHSCCEAQHIPQHTSGCSDRDHDRCTSENHKGCRNEVTYLKAPIISSMPVQQSLLVIPSIDLPGGRTRDAGTLQVHVFDRPIITPFLIPPRAGGSLVIFLHSIKIPFPEGHA